MEKFITGEIVPAERIGNFKLGWSVEKLKENLKEEYTVEYLDDFIVLTASASKFWVDKKTNKVSQISIFSDFTGKFKNLIGIKSTLADVRQNIGEWQEDLDVYLLCEYPGICFELQDEDDWDELTSPIAHISIFAQ